MQRKKVHNKRRIVTASLAGLLTVAVVSTALYKDSSVAYARPSLPGIEGIINSNSADQPFRILEIVDDYPSARIGYMIAGEEPGDVRNADAISDMASLDERADRFMTATTTTENTDAYKELDGYAFTYSAFEEKDPGTGNPYVETDAGVRNGKAFGSFVDNNSTPNDGRYDAADISGDYKKINDGTTETANNATIEDIYRKGPLKSDQSGMFYMHYAGVLKATTSSAAENRYDVTQFEEIDSDHAWMYPFKLFSEDRDDDNDGVTDQDSDGNDIVYTYYDQNRYVVDVQIEADYDPADINVAEDDEYTLLSSLSEGSIIYIDTTGDTFLEYAGFIKDDGTGTDTLVYEDKTGVTMPLQGTLYEKIDSDNDGVQDVDTSGNLVWGTTKIENLAHIISEATDTYCTVRVATGDDGAAVTKYHISKMVQNNTGLYERFTGRFQAVNDPAFTPETFGIVDENEAGYTAAGTPWYHVWYYKGQTTAPYNYNTNNPQDGKYDFVHDYSADEVNNYYFKGGYDNKERFKTEVLDVDEEKWSSICIDVVTKKLQDVTVEDINAANLIYFTGNGTFDKDSSGYIGWRDKYDVAAALITAVDKEHKAVIIDLKGVDRTHDFTYMDANTRNAILLLLQNDVNGISQCVGANDWNISTEKADYLSALGMAYYTNASTGGSDLSHVTGSVFVNDNGGTVKEAIASDFIDPYSTTKVDGFSLSINPASGRVTLDFDGFKEVKKDINEEKFYLEVAGKDVSKFNDKINKATSIRYILNYGNRRTVGKTAIRVLDIEPFYARDIEGNAEEFQDITALQRIITNNGIKTVDNIASIRDIFTKDWFTSNVVSADSTKDVDVTGMGTREFVGKIEDLNELYDLIYIGMDTAYMNTSVTNSNQPDHVNKSKEVIGNLSGFHYVYSHTGDLVRTNKVSNYNGNSVGSGGSWNMSGNDITPDKLRELQNYVKSGYAVILSDEFFNYNSDGTIAWDDENHGINITRVEKPSYMYDFIYWCISERSGNSYKYLYKNVEISKNFEATSQTTDKESIATHKESFVKYLNISKLKVEVLDQPLLYNPYDTNSNDVHHYLEMNNQGKYSLDFKVKLTNDAAVDTTNTSYDCKLYIDHDADGRFENVEALDSLEVINADNGDYINPSDGKYHLTTGTTYTISREVPEGYVGLLPWKLVFIENRSDEDAQIKTAVQDYSAISDLANKPTIRVLQLTQDQNGGADEPGNHPQPGNSNNYNHLNMRDDVRLNQLYDYVTEFKIDVDLVWVRDYIKANGTIFGNGKTRLENLNNYDIVVLGFSDSYKMTPDTAQDGVTLAMAKEAVLSLREYALSGKSILFTHDLTSPTHATQDLLDYNTLSNRYLRDIQGMDRFGFIKDNVQGLTLNGSPLTEYKSEYDTRFRTDAGQSKDYAKIGYTNQTVLRWSTSTYGDIAAEYTKSTDGSNRYTKNPVTDERQFYSVKRLNRGQVTEYPFRIGSMTANGFDKDGNQLYYANDYITVAQTHHQWYQLNLETDYNDTNYDDDVVVWYTLTVPGSSKLNYHRLDSDDARNNYYIFNKGNITYTGAGHWWIDGDEEKKLFVNTLVASYNAGKHAPYASYKSDDTIIATDITSTYIPYDIAFSQTEADGGEGDGWIEPTVTVYFKTVNNNLQDNQMPLITQYYVEVPSGGDIVIEGTNYKIITPKSIKECTIVREGTVSKPVYKTVYTDVTDARVLNNGKIYKLEFDVNDLMAGNAQGVNTRYHAKIYTRMRSQDKKNTIDEEKANMDNVMMINNEAVSSIHSLPANDSFKPLNVNFTQLYDLR